MGDKYGGSWIEPGREKSSLIGAVPLSFVNLNLTPSLGSKPALMDFSDVVELFGMVSMSFTSNKYKSKTMSLRLKRHRARSIVVKPRPS